VIRPGVYTLDRQSNVAQAILEAGGLTDRAVLDKVNLKGTLKDDMTIVVPALPRVSLVEGIPSDTSTSASNSSRQVPPVVATPAPSPSPAALIVVVKGAVARPGAQQLPTGSVVASAIVAAGGLAPNASIGAVNLQQPLRQGMTITIPVNKVVAASQKITPSPAPKPPELPATVPVLPLNINNATAAQLQSLPGVGPSLAARIIMYRREVGDFRTPEQLMDVKGITPDKFSQIQALVRTE
jgi:competence protein ComEA